MKGHFLKREWCHWGTNRLVLWAEASTGLPLFQAATSVEVRCNQRWCPQWAAVWKLTEPFCSFVFSSVTYHNAHLLPKQVNKKDEKKPGLLIWWVWGCESWCGDPVQVRHVGNNFCLLEDEDGRVGDREQGMKFPFFEWNVRISVWKWW